jgi:hypothetical protein
MTEASPSKVDVAESSAAIAATTTTEPTNTTNTNTTIDAPMNDDVSASPQRPAEAESRVSFAAELGAVASNWRSVRAEFGLSEQDIFRRSERAAFAMLLSCFLFFVTFFFLHFFFFFFLKANV